MRIKITNIFFSKEQKKQNGYLFVGGKHRIKDKTRSLKLTQLKIPSICTVTFKS